MRGGFLAGRISFPRIVDTVARIVSEHDTSRAGDQRSRTCSPWTPGRGHGRESLTGRLRGSDRGRQVDLLGWLIFLFALLFSVMLHESGHFVTAK